MNWVTYRDYIFTDVDIFSESIYLTNAMVCETLESDTLTISVTGTLTHPLALMTSDGEALLTTDEELLLAKNSTTVGGLLDYSYGEPIYCYHDETLLGKFYVQSITRTATNKYTIDAVSLVGLLVNMNHSGGIYNGSVTGDTVGTLIADIMGDIPYTIDETGGSIANVPIYGHLPIASKRDNLQQVLFAQGISLRKDAEGGIYFTYNQQTEAALIADDRLYIGGTRNYVAPATKVEVTEHAYYQSDNVEEKEVYNNLEGGVLADNETIVFDNPMHSLYTTDSLEIIDSSNPNFAIVSGVGTLIGKEYLHTQRILSEDIETKNAEEKEVSVTDATLVSSLNSNNVLARVVNYYTNADTVSYGLVVGEERPGDLVTYTDPFNEEGSGYIQKMAITASNLLKAETEITTNWMPKYVGNNFTDYVLIRRSDLTTGAGTLYVGTQLPEELLGKEALVVLFSGGQGGDGGGAGGCGGHTNMIKQSGIPPWYWPYMAGGEGGKGSAGGKCGRMITFAIDSFPAKIGVVIGEGGKGGSGAHWEAEGSSWVLTEATSGQEGGDTSFGDMSTEDGVQFGGNYANLITGEIYAKNGAQGMGGAAGGGAGSDDPTEDGYGTNGYSGESVTWTENGVTYTRAGGTGVHNRSDRTEPVSTSYAYYRFFHSPAGGGGAAGGKTEPTISDAAGGTVTNIDSIVTNSALSKADVLPSSGGWQDASADPQATMAGGGTGGNGGGGGGAQGDTAAAYYSDNESGEVRQRYNRTPSNCRGGAGSDGSDGGDGFIIIYY